MFPKLREVAVLDCCGVDGEELEVEQVEENGGEVVGLESLSLCGIRAGNRGFRWLWRRCRNLRRLQFRGCEGTGEDFSQPFARHLCRLSHLELRTCRSIADWVLLQVAEHCHSLSSLLLYDGGSRDGLRRFIRHSPPSLRILDFRLPLDLDNTHLISAAESVRQLVSLRLQSCCLITGDGLRSLGEAAGESIEELVLNNCDVVEKETGLLAFLGQSLRWLRRLDLSYNERLADRELGSMLASSRKLVDIRLRGCNMLTDAALMAVFRCCELLEIVDVTHCSGISVEVVEFFITNSRSLSRIFIEENKVSDTASAWAQRNAIEVC